MIFISKCQHCKANLFMMVRGKKNKFYSCSKCVDKNSSLRDDINESYESEVFSWGGKKSKGVNVV